MSEKTIIPKLTICKLIDIMLIVLINVVLDYYNAENLKYVPFLKEVASVP